MAIVPIRPSSYVPTAFVDSKAGGYVSIFTAQGWDQWRQAVESLSQVAADNQFAYEKKMKAYEAVTQAISTKRGDIVTKIADIQAKKADVLAKYALKNAELLQKAARDEAQVPSERISYSGRWSQSSRRTLWNPKYKEDGTLIPGGAGSAGVPVSPANLKIIQDFVRMAGMTDAEKKTEIEAALVAAGLPATTAQGMADSALAESDFVMGMAISPGQSEAGRGSSSSAGVSVSSSTGQTWNDYNAAQISELDNPALKEYDIAIKELQGKLGEKGLDVASIGVPVLEPIDLITTARQIYKDKFGDVPDSTTLRVDGEVVSVLKNLMPFEVTNGMKRSVDFFQRYIDEAIAQAKAAPNRDYPDGDLSVDELNRAVEYGKRRARQVLFGVDAPGGDVSGELSGKTSTSQGDPNIPKDDSKEPLSPPPVWPPVDPATFNNEPTGDQTAEPTDFTPDLETEYRDRLRRELDALQYNYKTPPIPQSTMQPTRGSTEAAASTYQPHTYFPTSSTYIGQKTEGEIPSYGGAAPNVAPTRPANIPYNLPPAGLGGRYVDPPELRGIGYQPPIIPETTYKPSRSPGLMPESSEELLRRNTIPRPKGSQEPKIIPMENPEVAPTMNMDGEAASRKHKIDAFLAGTKAATENPKGTAKGLVKDSIGQFVSTLFDENKSKGPNAKPVSTITEQLIKEYSGQPEKQKKAIQRYVELSTLDANSKRIG